MGPLWTPMGPPIRSGCDLDVREDARKGTHVAGAVEVAVGSLQERVEHMNQRPHRSPHDLFSCGVATGAFGANEPETLLDPTAAYGSPSDDTTFLIWQAPWHAA